VYPSNPPAHITSEHTQLVMKFTSSYQFLRYTVLLAFLFWKHHNIPEWKMNWWVLWLLWINSCLHWRLANQINITNRIINNYSRENKTSLIHRAVNCNRVHNFTPSYTSPITLGLSLSIQFNSLEDNYDYLHYTRQNAWWCTWSYHSFTLLVYLTFLHWVCN
jgi:hypothetical protein